MTSHTNPTVNGEVRVGLVPPSRWSEVPSDHSPEASPLPRSGAPEVADVTFSFLPLTDAAPFIVAHSKGWFREFGIESKLRRETSWTALRDALNTGAAQAAQTLFSMPVSSACGLLGSNQKPLVVPWILNRNGQAITLNKQFKGRIATQSGPLREAAIEGRNSGRPLVFGHTLRVGTHALWLRYWLAAGGIHPDNDVALITVPPPQMAANMRTARMDGFCVGEPWNARALAEGLGYTAITSQEIWPDHPEKVCAFTEEFAGRNPRTVVSALKGLHQAGVWLDDPANHAEAAQLLALPEHLGGDPALIHSRLGGTIDYGDGRTLSLPQGLTFSGRDANRPRASHAVWFLTQLRRWGLHFGTPDYARVSQRVIRADFHDQARRELGLPDTAAADGPETFFDGKVFDPSSPEAYAQGFELKNILG